MNFLQEQKTERTTQKRIELTQAQKIRLIAFYLPQYHPIPENDQWWGKGFTEWTNVAKAQPLFSGHYQPHLPADLGFYDLRLPEVRQAQANLAREYGIYGFCYYHYWFNGKRLLERPFQEVLDSGQPDFPFCLCWANENWTRAWDGLEKNILAEQIYSEEDDREHIRWLAKAFRDERYIRIEKKPLFLVYRANKIPEPLKTTNLWREEAQKLGVGDIFICSVERFDSDKVNPLELGFDAAVEFQPDGQYFGNPLRRNSLWKFMNKIGLSPKSYQENGIFDYATLITNSLSQSQSVAYRRFSCLTPQWDNSPRRKKGATILKNSTTELYEKWLKALIEKSLNNSFDEDLIFINAWNEWGEGNHLEPDHKWGHSYLEATQRAIKFFEG